MQVFTSKKYYDTIKSAVEEEHTQVLRSANLSHLIDNEACFLEQFSDLQMAKNKVSNARLKVLEELDRYLIQFEKQFTANGGKVFWADNTHDANERIKLLCNTGKDARVIHTEGRILEELDFFSSFKKKEKKPSPGNTDGFIRELTEEKFLHHNRVAMDNASEEIHEKLREKYFPEEDVISAKALSKALKTDILSASENDVLISEADFVATDHGALCFLSDSFDNTLLFSNVKRHIVVVGIDKLIPSIHDLEVLLPLRASASGTGKNYPVTTILTSPRKADEIDGPDEIIVLLVNNGRTKILENQRIRKVATCIHCGACQNHCPVYNIAGTAPYQIPYTSPYGVVTASALNGDRDLNHLNYATTQCGKCTDACPVDINLHEMIIFNRREAVKNGNITPEMKRYIRGYKFVISSRSKMNMGPKGIRNLLLRNHISNHWGTGRALPKLAPKNFSQIYAEKHR